MKFTCYITLWLLEFSPIFADVTSSSSIYPNVWTTKTIEETVTVNCDTTALSSTDTLYSGILASSHDILSGSFTTQITSHRILTRPPATTTTLIEHMPPMTSDCTLDTSETISTTSVYSSDTRDTVLKASTPSTALVYSSDTADISLTTHISLTASEYSHGTAETSLIYTSATISDRISDGTAIILTTSGLFPVATELPTIYTHVPTTASIPDTTEVWMPHSPPGVAGTSLVTSNIPLTTSDVRFDTTEGQESITTMTSLGNPLMTMQTEFVLPGASAIIIDGTPVSLGLSGTLVIGTSTLALPSGSSAVEVFTIGSQPITIGSTGFEVFIVPHETQTIATRELTVLPGGDPITIGTVPISLGHGGTLFIADSAQVIPATGMDIVTVNGETITAGQSGFVVELTSSSANGLAATPTIVPVITTADSISSTMTTIPPGFSIEAVTNTLWTANTWITTNLGGIPTIVPVLVGCPGCGGVHGGIILWNLPQIPWILFQLPGFPGLPGFHLPCIKLFGIRIAGDCDSPPSTDGDNSNNPTTRPSLDKTSSFPPSSSSSSSSTTSCSGTKVPSCTQLCELTTQSGGIVASSCASAICQTITACSATPTTSISYSFTTTSEWICAPSCLACSGSSSSSAVSVMPLSTSALQKRVFEEPPDPSNVAARHAWFLERIKNVTPVPSDMFEYGPNLFQGLSSSVLIPLNQADGLSHNGLAGIKPNSGAVKNLHGCTALIVASPEAIWIGHFWQTSFFSDSLFDKDVIKFMYGGAPMPGFPGLYGLTQDPDTDSHPFNQVKTPVVMMVNARDRDTPNVDAPAYPEYVERMRVFLRAMFPSSQAEEVNYIPALYRGDLEGVFGKVLVEYDPAQPDCNGNVRPTVRIWVQGDVVLEQRFYNYRSPAQAPPGKRDSFNSNSQCPLPWQQSITPYELTATGNADASTTYYNPTTFLTTSSPYEPPSTSSITSSYVTSTSAPTVLLPLLVTTVQTSLRTTIASSTPVLCVPFQDPDSDGSDSSYCQCSSSALTTTLPIMISTNNPCGYTSLPGAVITSQLPSPTSSGSSNPFPYVFTDAVGDIIACNTFSYAYIDGLSISECQGTRTTLTTALPLPSSPATTTSAAATVATDSVTCRFCDSGLYWAFVIAGWGPSHDFQDLGTQLDGCGALTGWDLQGADVLFNLPFFIKSGCVESAIQSAGGPSLSCQGSGLC